MKSILLKLVSIYVSLTFYLHFLYIPFTWFVMISDYTAPDPVLITQIEHGVLKGEEPVSSEVVRSGASYMLEERAATLFVKTDSVLPFIFFSQLGSWGDGMNVIIPFFTLALLWFLKRIIGSIEKGDIFSHDNAQRIKWIGWILIAKYIYTVAIALTMEYFLKTIPIPYEWARGHTPDGMFLHMGVLVLCIGLVYQKGVELKQEAELVV